MATEERMATLTNSYILTLTQWFSPAYPVGAFAYSHGLEWAIESGSVSNSKDTKSWLEGVLRHGAGRNDCLFLVAAFHAQSQDQLKEVNQTALSFSASSERLMETSLQGEAFCKVTSEVWTQDLGQLSYPVAVGYAATLHGLPLELTTQMYLQASMANLVAAATRLVPLGQTDGQRLIRDLTPLCSEIATEAQSQGLEHLGTSAFLSDIASMKHETQYSRIFRT